MKPDPQTLRSVALTALDRLLRFATAPIVLIVGCVAVGASAIERAQADGNDDLSTWHEVKCSPGGGDFTVDAEIGPLVVFTGETGKAWHQQPSADGAIVVADDGRVLVYTDDGDPECRAWAP